MMETVFVPQDLDRLWVNVDPVGKRDPVVRVVFTTSPPTETVRSGRYSTNDWTERDAPSVTFPYRSWPVPWWTVTTSVKSAKRSGSIVIAERSIPTACRACRW